MPTICSVKYQHLNPFTLKSSIVDVGDSDDIQEIYMIRLTKEVFTDFEYVFLITFNLGREKLNIFKLLQRICTTK